MARITYVKSAQRRYKMVPVIDPETGQQKVTPVLKQDGTPKTTKTGRAITRRLTVEDRSQPLPNLKCCKCHKEIEPGDSYKWFQINLGYSKQRKNFCSSCQVRPSDQTSSGNLAALYGTLEAAEDALAALAGANLSDIASVLTEAAEGVNEVAEQYTESADNMESGFGHETYQSQEIREKAEQLEQFASELEDAASEVEGMDDPDDVDEGDLDMSDMDEPEEPVEDDFEDPDDFAEAQERYNREREEWEQEYESTAQDRTEDEREERRQNAISVAENALCNSPF